MYGHHLLYSRVIRINRVRLPNLHGQLNREIKCPCRCIRTKYIYICTGTVLLFVLFIYQVYF